MPSPTYRRTCDICSASLKKNGYTTAGAQRFRCTRCGSSTTLTKPALTDRHVLRWFVSWLLDSFDPATVGISPRTFRRKIAHLWQIQPRPILTGEVHDVLILDGTWIGNMVCLIASSPTHVVAWHWATQENAHSWQVLMDTLPPPRIVVIDGGSGIAKALRASWPTTHIQRCLFHVFLNVKRQTTFRPVFGPSKDALSLTRALMQVTTRDEAIAWQKELARVHAHHKPTLNERTISRDRYGHPTTDYTHLRSRRAFAVLTTRARAGDLFTHLNPELHAVTGTIPRTTNRLEGGINSPLKALIATHRGMPPAHQRALTDWYLYYRTEAPEDPATTAARYHDHHAHIRADAAHQQNQPRQYDTALDWTELR
ncbi:IS1249 family transposase [Flaviflexus salsibiostraticola]|uniref:IS1249 family transposase n=1 Tax=Flaviflexus salsibiostraticola TaxID=1282737 RepID=A0A3Q8WTD4_9ACTO|nr:IS1249 family transposase [Flaviflexus salsibiostraticola]AZN29551.1 IS1249 family transposase [Flaviflexus salsibiostraticola]AZN29873.1 IS1249 family transposase [Flaviflexus salsibiostraticola]AZN30545.1 IS1249 family transposase [Flaviflexus salsibiostraticola]